MSVAKVIRSQYEFVGGQVFNEVAGTEPRGPWVSKITAAAGAPTVTVTNKGAVLTLEATSEVQVATLYFGDVLSWGIDEAYRAWLYVMCTDPLPVGVELAFGLASAQDDDSAALAGAALFRVAPVAAANVVTVRGRDGVHVTDLATNLSLGDAFKQFYIDFVESTLGKADVRFSMDNDINGDLQRVAPKSPVDLSSYSAGMQPFIQLQKTATTAVATATVRMVDAENAMPAS